jgi:selenocysteine-specific elongation factor
MVHIGSAERVATLSLIERWTLGPGEASWAQLRFFEPVAAVRGQRFIVRLPAPARTVGGGDVVDIAPQRRRTNASRSKQLAALRSASLSAALEAMLPVDRPRSAAQLATRLSVDPLDAEGVLRELKSRGVAVQLGPGYLSSSGWEKAVEQVVSILRAYHQAFPMRRGMPREEIRSKLKWTSAHWAGALERLVEAGVVREIGPLLALPVHRGGTSTRRGEVERVLDLLQRQPFSPPSGSELLAAAATEVMLLEAMADERLIVRVAAGLYFARDAYDRMVEQVLHLIVAGGQVTVAQVRDELDTSRKYALALLEHLDAEHITRRVGDVRVLGSKAS